MKKVIIFMFTLCLGLIAKAEDVLQVVPFSTTAGILENDWEEDKSFSINLTNTLTYSAMEFHIYLPEGMTLLEEGGSVSPAFEFNDTRFSGYTSKRVWYPYHDINVTNPEPGHYYVKIYCTEKDKELHKIKGTEGELFRVYFLTSENMPAGYYPIYVKGTVLGVDSQTGVYPETSVSFVTIKDSDDNIPANALLDMGNYMIPSFVESELPDNNVIINGICQNLVLSDGADFTTPCDFTATSASYSRTMGTTWGTICLPFAVASDENVDYYEISGIENDVLMLTKCDILPAGTPALVRKLSGDGIAPQATSVAVNGDINNVAGSVNMYGSYTNQTRVEDPNSYYIYNDKFYSCNQYFFCNAFRAYFTMEGVGAKMLHIAVVDDVVTAIDALTGEGVEAIYGEDGIQRNDLEPGINIVKLSNGKTQKIIIK